MQNINIISFKLQWNSYRLFAPEDLNYSQETPKKKKWQQTYSQIGGGKKEKGLRVYLCSCPKLSKISYPQIAVIH